MNIGRTVKVAVDPECETGGRTETIGALEVVQNGDAAVRGRESVAVPSPGKDDGIVLYRFPSCPCAIRLGMYGPLPVS